MTEEKRPLDDFIDQFAPKFPNRIELDVDGLEDKILEGAAVTLADSRLKSLLVELNTDLTDHYQRVVTMPNAAGLVLHQTGIRFVRRRD